MSAVKRDFKRRLARVEAAASATQWADAQAASHRESLRVLVKICETIRKRFLLMGLDPALAASLKRGEHAAAELAAIPDSEGLRTADKAITRDDVGGSSEVRSRFEAKAKRMAAAICEGVQPDFAKAPVGELFVFCIAMEKVAWE